MEAETKELIIKYAVKNAMDYGKASASSVLGKVISKLKKGSFDLDELKRDVSDIVEYVNTMGRDKLAELYKNYEGEFEEEDKAKIERTSKPSMVLEGAEYGNFATRFAPEPNGFMHIGNAKAAMLAEEFSKIYNGKIFLYFDDTNPEKERQEYVDMIRNDTAWLGIKFAGEYFASDNLEKVYEYAKRAIENGSAYVCTCSTEAIKKNRLEMKECEHRSQSPEENMRLFDKMLSGEYGEGEAVLRFKGDMHSSNTVLRDPTLMRIKRHPHYRQGSKYIVWPTYDFNTPIMDSIHGITDAIRSKEYELRNALYYMVLDAVGLRKPRVHLEARLVIKNNITHKRVLRTLISEGKLSGYDDPRLVTIAALRRRGIQPQAIRNFVLRFGMSMSDSVVDIGMLLSENKSIIDPIAKRLFYVENPIKLIVDNAEPMHVSLRMHPTIDMGERSYDVGREFYISGNEQINEGDVLRLKDLYDIRIKRIEGNVYAEKVEVQGLEKKIQWVPVNNAVKCSVLIPGNPLNDDGSFNENSLRYSNGFIESSVKSMRNGAILQLERFGYAIIDDISNISMIFISK